MSKRPSKSARESAQSIASQCIGARVRILNRKITRMYDEALRPLGIKFSQLNILTFVTLRGPVQASVIAETLSIEKSTLSRNLDLLEANGWLTSSPGDGGNARYLQITRAGGSMVEKAAPAWAKAQDEVKTLLGERTAETVKRAGSKM